MYIFARIFDVRLKLSLKFFTATLVDITYYKPQMYEKHLYQKVMRCRFCMKFNVFESKHRPFMNLWSGEILNSRNFVLAKRITNERYLLCSQIVQEKTKTYFKSIGVLRGS